LKSNRYENESDRLCRTLIAQLLMKNGTGANHQMERKSFEVIETAVDKCEERRQT